MSFDPDNGRFHRKDALRMDRAEALLQRLDERHATITTARAREIKEAYIKHKGWYGHEPQRHKVEIECFMDGMRAMANEWLRSNRAKTPHK